MKKTRHPGLYRLEDKRWLVRATPKCPRTGQMKQKKVTLPSSATEAEALAALTAAKDELKGDAPAPVKTARRSLSEYAERWLEGKAARLKPSAADRYASTLAEHILPELGSLHLDGLSRADVETWVAGAEGKRRKDGSRYAAESLQGWWRILRQLLQDMAAETGRPDPTARVRPPEARGVAKKRERRTLTGKELGLFLSVLRDTSPQRYAEGYVLAYTGMRPGELYALTWDDVDAKRGRILIGKSVWRGQEGTPKTGDPREVALTAEMAGVLESHRALVRLLFPGKPMPRVFPSDTGGARNAHSLQKAFAQAESVAELGVHVTPQVLRRTFNTLLVEAGVDRIVLRSQMGHCSETMTERYAGVSVGAKREAVERVLGPTLGA